MRLASRLSFVLLLIAAPLAAQEIHGGIRGRLVSSETGPIVNATVLATGVHLQGERRTFTSGDGVFFIQALPPGLYTLTIRAIGHRPLVIQDVDVRLGAISGLGNLTLEAAAVDLTPLEITAPAATIDPVRTTLGARLAEEDFATLPVQRDYKSAIAILPHVNTSYHGDSVNVGGSTGLENGYFVDGINVTSEWRAQTGMTLPWNFVRAVEVKAGGYEAQYGKALGAVVNAITHAGTNDFETAAFGFFSSAGLQATPRVLPTLSESGAVSYDVGARVSGPVVRDRLWFSAAYNPRVDRVSKEVSGLGLYSDRRTAHLFAGKVTWQASRKIDLTLSVFGDPTTHHAVDLYSVMTSLTPLTIDPYLRLRTTGGVAGTLRASVRPVPWLTLHGRVAYSRTNASDRPDLDTTQSDVWLLDFVASTTTGYGPTFGITQGRGTAALRGTADLGRHTIVIGGEYEDARISTEVSQRVVLRQDSALWIVNQQAASYATFHNRIPTAYAQDTWRLTDRLSLNGGIRWSAQLLTGASGSTAQKFPDEWQPRLGFSWQLGPAGLHRVFGSYGRFYQQIPLNFSSIFYRDYYYVNTFYSQDPRSSNVPPDAEADGSTYEGQVPPISDLDVENFDEFTLGYEGVLGGVTRVAVRGVHRYLRSAFTSGADSLGLLVVGTPGKGAFDFLPPPKRTYTALELSVTGGWRRIQYRASYVLSRTWGNYTGLFGSDDGYANPGVSTAFGYPEQAINSGGLLPNDRPHVFKVAGAYNSPLGLTVGLFVAWMSGTPITEFGGSGGGALTFLSPRGTAGRTPSIWDLNLRFAYDIPWPRSGQPRIVLDLLHLGNPRETVRVDQRHYYATDADGNPTNLNSNYLAPVAYQLPTTARLGVEVNF